MTKRYWEGTEPVKDSFGNAITDTFIDGRTPGGTWGMFNPTSWQVAGCGQLGTGFGQRYEKQADGRWLKVEG